nr:flagellar basal body P-ring formation chaperone FlgA [Pseudorhodobacter ferrugineus]
MRLFMLFVILASPAFPESLIATRIVRAQTLLSDADVTLVAAEIPGALTSSGDAVGLEARVTLYPGRAIRIGDVGPPALVERNQLITLIYSAGGLGITTEGRALARGGVGDVIQVMNLSSRAVLAAQVLGDGSLRVGSNP